MKIVLGSGLSGLSLSHHLNSNKLLIFEKKNHAGGHIYSENINGFTFDEGPHVSFTKSNYVKKLFESNANNEILEYPIEATNYFKGSWIPHPAQTNLYALNEILRKECLDSFLESRINKEIEVKNYKDWLNLAFGKVFSKNFPEIYTKKYWTTEPENLTTKWVGQRVFYPNVEDVTKSYNSPLTKKTHYITEVRYPKHKGYFSFASNWAKSAKIEFSHELEKISFAEKEVIFTNGLITKYNKLISTIPLPILIKKSDAPEEIKNAANELSCSSVFLINVMAKHPTKRKENWIYVYDEDKYSTRINCTELLSPNNAPSNQTGIQVEVYFSKYKSLNESLDSIKNKVIDELIEMQLLEGKDFIIDVHTKWVDWANVIFDHQRETNLNIIFEWLTQFGLKREDDDLDPMTDWDKKFQEKIDFTSASIILAGRFAQWKYYWTDDCVLRGKYIGDNI
jgi:protoporphyrinogen oxidase